MFALIRWERAVCAPGWELKLILLAAPGCWFADAPCVKVDQKPPVRCNLIPFSLLVKRRRTTELSGKRQSAVLLGDGPEPPSTVLQALFCWNMLIEALEKGLSVTVTVTVIFQFQFQRRIALVGFTMGDPLVSCASIPIRWLGLVDQG